MKFSHSTIVCFALLALAGVGLGAKWNKDDEEGLQTNLELDEYDFEDVCSQQIVQYEWNSIINNVNGDKSVLENFAKNQKEKAERWMADREGHKDDEYPSRNEAVARKLELISRPGDVILPQEKYSQLLAFESDISSASVNRRSECEKTPAKSCKLTSRDPEQLLAAWNNLELFNSTSDLPGQYPDILQLLSEAAKANGYPSVRAYWLMLSELNEDGYEKANALWGEIRPFYQKCHAWVAKHLRKKYGSVHFEAHDSSSPETIIPSYLLGTRLGMDWTNIADLVLSKECQKVHTTIQSTLKEKKIAGKELYQMTEKMTDILEMDKLPSNLWKYSLFNQSCPARTVDPCKQNLRVAACNKPSWSEYLNAHEIAMQGVYSDRSDSLSYLLKNGNRYSALDTAVPGVASIIASNRHYLAQQNLLNLPDDEKCVKNVLLVLLALRELPKLPYYLVADKARLQAIETNDTSNVANIWRQLRLEEGLSQPESDWWSFLEDPHIALNRPYISQFYASVVKFQLYGEMLTRDEAVSADTAPFISAREEFRTLLRLGKTKRWPALLEDTFKLKTISSEPLLRFFSRLDSMISPDIQTVPVPKAVPTTKAPTTVPTVHRVQKTTNETTEKIPVAVTKSKTEPKHPAKVTDEAGGVGIGTILFILCAIMMGIALIAAIVNYSRKRFSKNKEYQRPPNQPV